MISRISMTCFALSTSPPPLLLELTALNYSIMTLMCMSYSMTCACAFMNPSRITSIYCLIPSLSTLICSILILCSSAYPFVVSCSLLNTAILLSFNCMARAFSCLMMLIVELRSMRSEMKVSRSVIKSDSYSRKSWSSSSLCASWLWQSDICYYKKVFCKVA